MIYITHKSSICGLHNDLIFKGKTPLEEPDA